MMTSGLTPRMSVVVQAKRSALFINVLLIDHRTSDFKDDPVYVLCSSSPRGRGWKYSPSSMRASSSRGSGSISATM